MDTVVYRLHNLEKYPIVIKAVERLKGGRGMLLIEDLPDLQGVTSLRQALINKDRDSFRLMAYNAKLFIPSSSSGINLRYDDSQRFIEFNVSLPKFFFGNNVCELIPPIQHKKVLLNNLSMEELCLQYWWKAMKWAFRKMIKDLTRGLGDVDDWGDVQLFRWDIAFNQIFNSKADAMHYLESIGRVSAPRIVDGNKQRYDNNNVTFKTENYYFKVYHKGTDFAHTGAAQVRKLFKELGGSVTFKAEVIEHPKLGTYKINHEVIQRGNMLKEGTNIELSMNQIDQLQSYADNILRYEFEATSKFMSYVYNTRCAKIRIPAYHYLHRATTYVCREENLRLYNELDIRYRNTDGNLSRIKEKYMIYTTEYYLPARMLDAKSDNNDMMLVVHPQTIQRIEKILKIYHSLYVKFGLKGVDKIKKIHKYLESQKSKEHRFFFGQPFNVTQEIEQGKRVYYYEPIKSAQEAISPNEIPANVHYDGPIMQVLEEVHKDQQITGALMRLCIRKHNELFKILQFEKLPEIKEVELLVKAYNEHIASLPRVKGEKKEQKMNVRQMKLLFRRFKHDTWSDLRRGDVACRKTINNWKKKVEKLFSFAKSANFIADIDLTNVSREPQNLYSRHYHDLQMQNIPLSLFLQNSPQLLLF